MKIRSGDLVLVTSGDDKSGTPRKVLQIADGGSRLVVEGVNRVYKHVKRGHPKSMQGGRLSVEMPISVSNVALYCAGCSKGTRVGFRFLPDGSKERFCRKCSTSIGLIAPARSRHAEAASK